ncbi:hypothetical protein ACHAPU_006420 [Fusarium lateritium]
MWRSGGGNRPPQLTRVNTANLPSGNQKKYAQPAVSSFPQGVTLPGGRHDNDFLDISKISIIPTQDEILSEHTEYLPSKNFLHPHVLEDPLQRYIDSTFRQARHDIMGPIKDVLREQLATGRLMNNQLPDEDSRVQAFESSNISRIHMDNGQGMDAIVSFLPPESVLRKSPTDQHAWWRRCHRLGSNTLLCFVVSEAESPSQRLLFLQMIGKSKQRNSDWPDPRKGTQVSQHYRPSIIVRLATEKQCDLALLVQLYQSHATGVLVNFVDIIPPIFTPILENLQRIKQENHVAFHNWILPTPDGNNKIPSPLYARKEGFVFPLGCISKNGNSNIELDPKAEIEDINIQEIEEATGLDHSQCLGLVGALTREYALIHGPPGTGKSYLGVQLVRTLLAVKEQAGLGPILIICYKNHTLDQFLKHLLDVGIDAIVRVGGTGVAEELVAKNLKAVSKKTQKTRIESQILEQALSEQNASVIHRQLRLLINGGNDPLKTWLAIRPRLEIDRWISVGDAIALAEKYIYVLQTVERLALVDHWLQELQDKQIDCLYKSLRDSDSKREVIHRTHDAVDQRTLAQADVVGITTTSLAGRISMLRSLTFKVVICEEAAEVRESDIISALKDGVEHFIQIGQLPPRINTHDFGMESSSAQPCQLERSQFERRIVGEPGLAPAPFVQLGVQRRMRPEISQLVQRVYPSLQNHATVCNHEDVVGMHKNVFWLDHNHPEDTRDDDSRHTWQINLWEVDMATALVKHLVRQGVYRTEDIALLTPYPGQLQQLRKSLSNEFEICLSDRDTAQSAQDSLEEESGAKDSEDPLGGSHKNIEKKPLLQSIRLATLDNFQGEEAKIIIVFLTRSNPQRQVGLLGTESRINMLLSRAKNGMYLIGNSETYMNIPMWADVHNQLFQAGSVGNEIELSFPKVAALSAVRDDSSNVVTNAKRVATRISCTTLSCARDLVSVSERLAVINALEPVESNAAPAW